MAGSPERITGLGATLGSETAAGVGTGQDIAAHGPCSCMESLVSFSPCLLQMACKYRKECAERLFLLLQTAPATGGIANMHIAMDATKMNGKA